MADELQKPAAAAPQAIHHELRTAENSAAYLLPKLYSMREASQHLKILDVGAGSGTISTTFAKAIPKGTVTAVDLNPDILQRAGAVAESAGVSNITFQQADACSLPFEDETFDITHCHQVLAHLKEPWVALGEMIRVTKPGGIVAAREGDAETQVIWPELPGLIQFNKLVGWAISAGGGSSAAGRRLLSWALRAGAQRSRITASYSAWGYSEPAEKQVWGATAQAMAEQIRGGRMRRLALKEGFLSEDDLEAMACDWATWAASEDASLGMMHGEILIQKQ